MASPHVQRVPKMLLAVNDWIASGKVDKQQGQQLSNLTLSKNESMMLLADEIGVTPDSELLSKAIALLTSSSSSPSSASATGPAARKGRPALNIGTVKNANATAEAAHANEVESQADALLKAKRERNLKRQSLPEKGLPDSVNDQVRQ